MDSSSIARYLETVRSLQQAENDAIRMLGVLRKVTSKLGKWEPVVPQFGQTALHQISPVSELSPAELPLEQWPSAQELRDALDAYRSTFQETRVAWDAIPHELRTGLASPPGKSQ